jgi:hypothetical protein
MYSNRQPVIVGGRLTGLQSLLPIKRELAKRKVTLAASHAAQRHPSLFD